jgi:shikimate kinase
MPQTSNKKIFIIGPGGVGKTTSGKILANLLDYKFIDLDDEFCNQIENIGTFMKNKSYKKYCYENSKLFYKILNNLNDNFVFVLSSGFLVYDGLDDLTTKHKCTLKEKGLSILLLPSKSISKSINIVVARQLKRGLGLKETTEKREITNRFPKYIKMGDIQIFSYSKPKLIAEKMKKELKKI